MITNLKALIGKLNEPCRHALESAAGLTLSRSNYEVDVEHYFLKLTEENNIDLKYIFRNYEIDSRRLAIGLTECLSRLRTGNTRSPVLSYRIPALISEAWVIGSILYAATEIRSGHLLLALLQNDDLFPGVKETCRELKSIDINDLEKNFYFILKDSKEYSTNTQSEKFSTQIFISYRHEEWASARTIYKDLTNHFGPKNVFRDQDILVGGDDWKKVIEDSVSSCSAMLVLIGKYWASAQSLRQLHSDDDWIQFEIRAALSRNIRLIPVLLNGARMPKTTKLPNTLHALTQRQAIPVNDSNFDDAIAKLLLAVGKGINSQSGVVRGLVNN